METLRIGVIGAGHLGRIHTRLAQTQEHIELVGIVDPIDATRQQVAAEFQLVPYASHHALIDRMDAAIIATPTKYHRSVAVDLLRAGLHVFIEKPIAVTLDEAETIAYLANHHQRVLQIGHVERFNPALIAAQPFLDQPKHIETKRTSGYSFRSTDIGVVLDLMIHDIDIVLSLCDSPVAHVDAVGTTVVGPHEDIAHARMEFENGCVVNLHASRVSRNTERSMQILTDQGSVEVDFSGPTSTFFENTRTASHTDLQVDLLTPLQKDEIKERFFKQVFVARELEITPSNAILKEQQEFFSCIRKNARPQIDGTVAISTMEVASQILAAIQQRQVHQASPQKPFATLADIAPIHGQRKAG
ncbi:MAG: Gfo/Idh/MocA family oxidoreductase [Pirellulaceae bacterium]|nr:Gfo/Idh/MocA family oxidoreductase [Pirellulaceae bacterium]